MFDLSSPKVARGQALRYNPGMSWTVQGHDWAVKMLQQHIAAGAIRHAYLFAGSPSIGRRTLALQFAQAINCAQPPEPGVPCGECRTCRQIGGMQQPDLTVVQSERAGGSLKVEQVRDLQHTLSLSPYESRYRVALLLRFEEATTSAQNALLKTLEEAPERAILLLTADSPENLLPTIVSRCEILRMRPLKLGQVGEILQARGLEAAEATRLAHLSGGKLGYALQLAQEPSLQEAQEEWIEALLDLLNANLRERFAYAGRFRGAERDQVHRILQTWLLFWRDVFLTRIKARVPLFFLRWQEKTTALAGKLEVEAIQAQIFALEKALQRLETTNVNTQMLLEVLLVDWPRIRV